MNNHAHSVPGHTFTRLAREIRNGGTFTYSATQVPDDELCQYFADRLKSSDAASS
jgi:hypothetical protein